MYTAIVISGYFRYLCICISISLRRCTPKYTEIEIRPLTFYCTIMPIFLAVFVQVQPCRHKQNRKNKLIIKQNASLKRDGNSASRAICFFLYGKWQCFYSSCHCVSAWPAMYKSCDSAGIFLTRKK